MKNNLSTLVLSVLFASSCAMRAEYTPADGHLKMNGRLDSVSAWMIDGYEAREDGNVACNALIEMYRGKQTDVVDCRTTGVNFCVCRDQNNCPCSGYNQFWDSGLRPGQRGVMSDADYSYIGTQAWQLDTARKRVKDLESDVRNLSLGEE